MKVVLIHTSPVSLNDLKALFKEIVPEVEMVNIIDDSLLDEVKKVGHINSNIISRMCAYVQVAKTLKPDLIFNQCSSVGEAFDIEIIEKHHNQKIDAPSGTALMIADEIASVTEYSPEAGSKGATA